MDPVINQLNEQNKVITKQSTFKIIYKIYHFIAKVVLYSLLLILILLAVAFIAYFIDLEKNIKSGVTKQPLFGAYVIISPSMVPTINVEDAVVVQRKESNELKVGDIITFLSSDPRYSGLTITHRIVGAEKSKKGDIYFRTKGDNNNTEDTALVKSENIYGKVILRIPKIGYLQYFLTQSYGWIILIVIPCFGVIIYDIVKIFRSVSKNKNDKNLSKNKETKIEEDKTMEILNYEQNNDEDIEILNEDGDDNENK